VSGQDRQSTYNVTLRFVLAAIVAMESSKCYVFWVCVYNLAVVIRNANGIFSAHPSIVIGGLSVFTVFFALSYKRNDIRKKDYWTNSMCFKRDVHESVHRDTIMKITNKMQLYRVMSYSKSALRVSGDVFAHHREDEFQLIHDTTRQQLGWILPGTVRKSSAPVDGRKRRPKHVELTRNNKLTYIVASGWLLS